MSCGSLVMPMPRHVAGRNCIGPTARSYSVSPSNRPPSLSRMSANAPVPSRRGPRMGGSATPSGVRRAPPRRAWLDSTLPMAASSDQLRSQAGSTSASRRAAAWYAARAGSGMPDTLSAARATFAVAGVCSAASDSASGSTADGSSVGKGSRGCAFARQSSSALSLVASRTSVAGDFGSEAADGADAGWAADEPLAVERARHATAMAAKARPRTTAFPTHLPSPVDRGQASALSTVRAI
jgi:hypothetical protein